MIQVLRVWSDQGVNLQYTVDNFDFDKAHQHIKEMIVHWDSAALWKQLSKFTWKNDTTGERIELLVL